MKSTLSEQMTMTPPPSVIPSSPVQRAKCGKAPIISNAILRSERVHNNTKGFKTSGCKQKDCLGCSSDPLLFLPLQ